MLVQERYYRFAAV